jgi:hypothetical protein
VLTYIATTPFTPAGSGASAVSFTRPAAATFASRDLQMLAGAGMVANHSSRNHIKVWPLGPQDRSTG